MAKYKRPTLRGLLQWAKGKVYISVFVDGTCEVEDFVNGNGEDVYSGSTLYKALLTAKQQVELKEKG